MSSFIENSYAVFHTSSEVPLFGIINENENEKFGIISLKIKKTNIINTPTLFLFTIDTTGSMDEPAYKNITKLQVVKQTFRSMMNYLSILKTQIYVRVHSFNENVTIIVDNILISQDNVNDIICKIDKLYADRSTNIGEALKYANDTMNKYSIENPQHQLVHIFMTDGQATSGITNNNELVKIVDTKHTNNFIGFGFDHNAVLLKKLSDLDNSEYLFVDNMENTTLIYGEIIHRYLYSAIKNAEIVIKDGIIYNWKTNNWNTNLIEPIIVSELEKIYHIKTTNIADINIKLYGVNTDDNTNTVQLLDVIDVVPELIQMKEINNNDNEYTFIEEEVPTDLSKYMFRQRTQELLFKSNKSFNENQYEKQKFKNELNKFFKNMRKYMRKNDLLKDKFMITLCDDICITYRSYGTDCGLMYSTSRSTSQGRQQAYNVTPIKPGQQCNNMTSSFLEQPKLIRNSSKNKLIPLPEEITENWGNFNNMQRTVCLTQEFIEEETYFDNSYVLMNRNLFVDTTVDNVDAGDDNIDDYNLSNDNTSCYATEGTLNTMNLMSQM